MDEPDQIKQLEGLWDVETGFLAGVRRGHYSLGEGREFLSQLEGIKLGEGERVSKRLVQLLWFIPTFMHWQEDRIAEAGGQLTDYQRLCVEVADVMLRILGAP